MTDKLKSQAEIQIEALADVFGIATTGFDDFYKKAKESKEGIASTAASSGYYSTAASSGNGSTAASSGDYSKAASSGDGSKAASSGDSSGCTAIGYRAAVSGDIGNLIMASEYTRKHGKLIPVGGKADIVDGKKLKPNAYYIVECGEWVEVDFTDGVFSRVISSKKGIKKIKSDNGDIAYIVADPEGNSAHGKTLKEAAQELQFKTASRDVSKYQNMANTTRKTPEEWAFVYRVITGACQYGTKQFMESKGELKKTYTLSEIITQTKGAYGHDKFKSVVGVKHDR